MTLPPPFLAVLSVIVGRLDVTQLTWAVTGSCSLALQGVPVVVHDIDLRTTAEDAYALEALFPEYQKRPVVMSSTDVIRSHFGALEVNGIQVEIIGDMQHRLADGAWEPPADVNQFKVWVETDGLRLPVMSLPFLYHAYRQIDRADKVAILRQWLQLDEDTSPDRPIRASTQSQGNK